MINFLHQAASPPALKKSALNLAGRYTEAGELVEIRCAFTGKRISTGYAIKNVITAATAEVSDTFRYPSQYVSVEVAELFRAQTLLRGNLLFVDAELLQPMVSLKSATAQDRPCWRNLIFEMEHSTPTIAVFTDESKRRLWHQAQLSAFGENWRPFFNGSPVKSGKTFKATPVCRSLSISVSMLRNCLNLVEKAQTFGFSKRGIYESLLSESNHVEQIGYQRVIAIEKALRRWRETDEFLLAVFIAQGILDPNLKTQNNQPPAARPGEQLNLFP